MINHTYIILIILSELNQFADVPEEKLRKMLGGRVSLAYRAKQKALNRRRRWSLALAAMDDPPVSLDWRNISGVSYVTPAKNQGYFETCYSFAAAGAVESQVLIKGYAQQSLSEKQIVDCWTADPDPTIADTVSAWESHPSYNWHSGIDGGDSGLALQYLQDAGGEESEANYPYNPSNAKLADKCSFDSSVASVVISNHGALVEPQTDAEIKKVLYNKGPVI